MLAARAMNMFALVRPLVFAFDPENAHRLTINFLQRVPRLPQQPSDPVLASTVAGLRFPTPVGLAAGFDKDGEVPGAMLSLGFGFVEIGTLTPQPQAGNPRPRLFRLAADAAVINRMGFNNGGLDAAFARLTHRPDGIVGINVGANKDSADRIADYVTGVTRMAPLADYLTINISSPNTPGLRALQAGDALSDLLAAVNAARLPGGPPIFLKVAPDLDPAEIDSVARAIDGRIDALIIGNTTITRPALRSADAGESGGLSGRPLAPLARQRLRDFRLATGGLPLIAAGGIDSAAEAYARIRAGASLVQLYSALVFHGPGLVRRINRELASLLRRDGFAGVADAVGIDVR